MDPSYQAAFSPSSAPELEPLLFSLTLTRGAASSAGSIRLPEGLLDSMLHGQPAEKAFPWLHLRISPYEMLHLRSEVLLSSIQVPCTGAYVLQFESRGLIKGRYQVKLCLGIPWHDAQGGSLQEWLLLGHPSGLEHALAGPPLSIVEQVISGVSWPQQQRAAR